MKKIIVIGGEGFIGRHLVGEYGTAGIECLGTTRHRERENRKQGSWYLDLLQKDYELPGREEGFETAIITAAQTRVDLCEQDPRGSAAVNVEGMQALLEYLGQRGLRPVFLSTDYVFDGVKGGYSEEDAVCPSTEYGRQKAAVEDFLVRSGRDYSIVRLSKVFGVKKGDRTMLDEMAGILYGGGRIRAAWDQRFCPMEIADFVQGITEIIKRNLLGIIHLCGPRAWVRYDLAREVARALGFGPERVEKISLNDLGMVRPRDTSLKMGRFPREVGMEFTPMAASIARIARQYRPDS